MHKKTDFLLGLLLGGATAVLAFRKMDPVRRRRLLDLVHRRVAALKGQAIDYAFYTDDRLNHTSGALKRQTRDVKSALKNAGHRAGEIKLSPWWHAMNRYLNSVLHHSSNQRTVRDDIILNADEAPHRTSVVFYPDGRVKNF